MNPAKINAVTLSIQVILVKYKITKPIIIPIVEYVSVCKCFPLAINANELFFLSFLSQNNPTHN